MNILICNDDGIFSEGILTLAKYLSKNHKVIVVAPNSNRSACSHSMSFYKELVVKEEKILDNFLTFSISGTPADCVKFALFKFGKIFDLVIGGINIGNNVGTDILYSGTVSIALEACVNGIKSVAFSVSEFENVNFDIVTTNCLKILEKLTPYLSNEYVWNVNVPNKKIDYFKIVKVGVIKYTDTYITLDNGNYMLVGQPYNPTENDGNTDVDCFFNKEASATPIIINKTNYNILNKKINM